mmetsp:Transcript_23271/g.58861  ORF Transcript_23271/g.58861 Transcript_23271/m.58861 type:complete len:565 (-) Transcript_23271:427-2121(-)|eukprot:CAMPEP_0178983636 /NCGR_PEP_ID=MMETSP0795-20121207/1168_1 /TAXON_ID=88552 /ORGANISM="Amoebophrya sp., Strain Ameob2" /LENGTH=564 /DNA_ID=CAMNT_0020674427 /DNA_START=100 /DNA_END=1794 /DNA_ORIENTATION=-
MDQILPFTEAKECTPVQLVVVTVIYGGILFYSAGMIGDGSELLLLIPAYADLVGSVVLPVLGAVPDGMMVLFSGIGPRMDAQEQVSVGVGALAGSTIMLLTGAWYAGAYGGRVSIVKGVPQYKAPKLTPPDNADLSTTGYQVGPKIRKNSIVMMITALLYLFVQIPALMVPAPDELAKREKETGVSVFDQKANAINSAAVVGLAVCVICFFAYLYLQTIKDQDSADAAATKLGDFRYESIRQGKVTLRGAMEGVLNVKGGQDKAGALLDVGEKEKAEMKRVLKPFFQYYDADKSGSISQVEFGKLMTDLRETMAPGSEEALFKNADVDGSGHIDFNEFVALMIKYLKGGFADVTRGNMKQEVYHMHRVETAITPRDEAAGDEENDDEEEEEIPEDLQDLSPEQQQRAIMSRSLWMMGAGTILVLVFSDPAVDVLNEIGKRTGIPAFYISFVLAPLASNASELVATYKYGCKKTVSSMTISLATLLGAACMNNTFCLAIFYALIWCQQLVWSFTAEVAVIILVQFIVGVIALKSVQKMRDATIILACYPLSLVFVWVLNNIFDIP